MLTTHFIRAAGPPGGRLMIVLHGLGDSLEGWLWLPGALQLPWLNFLLVNAPDPYYGGYSWYDIESGAGIETSRQLLFQLLDGLGRLSTPPPSDLTIPSPHEVGRGPGRGGRSLQVLPAQDAGEGLKAYPAGQIVLCGFSQGCLMVIEAGARYPQKFAGIVGISGYVHEPEKLIRDFSPAARQQRFLLTHGTQDPLIPIQKMRQQVALLKKAGLKIEWREFVKPHAVAGEEELAVIRQFVQDCYTETPNETAQRRQAPG